MRAEWAISYWSHEIAIERDGAVFAILARLEVKRQRVGKEMGRWLRFPEQRHETQSQRMRAAATLFLLIGAVLSPLRSRFPPAQTWR